MNRTQDLKIFVAIQLIILEITFTLYLFCYVSRCRQRQARNVRRVGTRTYNMNLRIPDQVKHLRQIVELSGVKCVDNLRMSRNAFGHLCQILENSGALRGTRHLTISEQVAIFLNVLAHYKKNCVVKHDFIHNGRTISKYFHSVLSAVLRVQPMLLPGPSLIGEECQDLGGDDSSLQMNPTDQEGTSNPRRYREKSDKTTTRRTWTRREEEALVNALCTICCTAWRCENGFRAGNLNQLEALMLKQFPNSDIRVEPHINSKIHVWKKYYSTLVSMMGKSGFRWDNSWCMIMVDSQDVWDEYCKVDTTARTMRFKSWPFFPAWREILVETERRVLA
ncbi:UNVERIFIED_CONTAM: hypothetical protein Slati_4505000 [Sesamum latifolium]|uniref:Myb/SANT-like domain-containing protein n=1 Tax=Sesamum latifolium TaxID=2727402 RepID=A0AAW2SU79_9LAMI